MIRNKDWREQPPETQQKLLEYLAQQRKRARVTYLTPLELAGRAGITPDDWQRQLLESDDRQLILCCSRQTGKSLMAAILSLHTALFVPESLTLLLAPRQAQAAELYRKVLDIYSKLSGMCGIRQVSALRLEFENKSRILIIPCKESTTRGYSNVTLLVADEASRIGDEVFEAQRPALAVSRGKTILLSTPRGSAGFFWETWTKGKDWLRFKISASECPRISPSWLEQERQRLAPFWFAQEYLCTFSDSLSATFRTEDFDRAISPEVRPLWIRTSMNVLSSRKAEFSRSVREPLSVAI